jgi:hypothetical protein
MSVSAALERFVEGRVAPGAIIVTTFKPDGVPAHGTVVRTRPLAG